MPRFRPLLLGAAALALTLAGCNGEEAPDEESFDPAEAFTEDPDCFGLELAGLEDDEVSCGMVSVPLDHDDPDGELIEIAVATIAGDGSAEHPVLILGGGPGQVMIETILTDAQQQGLYASDRDTILIDQRGVGLGDPALECPNLQDDELMELTGEDTEEILDAYRACYDDLREQGIDLDAFNHVANAHDLDVVRAALGHEQLDVRGGSYGAHLALHVASLYPDEVRSVVLSSPIDPSTNFAEVAAIGFEDSLSAVAEACAATPACDAEIDDVLGAIEQVVDRLADAPEELTVQPPDGDEVTYTFTPSMFLDGLFTLFYLADGGFALPALVADAADGDLEPLAEIVALVAQELEGASTTGMQVSMLCSGESARFDPETAREPLSSSVLLEHWFPYDLIAGEAAPQLCDTWEVDDAFDPDGFDYATEVPALVVTGSIDHITPPAHGDRIVEELDTAYLVEVEGLGHSPLEVLDLFTQGCGASIVEAFLEDPTQEPDSSCVEQMPPFAPVGVLPQMPGG